MIGFTYGDELFGPRRADENGKILEGKHHHLTFTHKLAEKLGVDYVNLAFTTVRLIKRYFDAPPHFFNNPQKK